MGILKRLFGRKNDGKLHPESGFVVAVSAHGVTSTRPNGEVESVDWDDLRGVAIRTTDQGPWFPDLFWVLVGDQGGCVIPQGATEEDVLLKRLQELPGFNNEAVINASTFAENDNFVCWERQGSAEQPDAPDGEDATGDP